MANLFVDGSKLFHHIDRANDWMQGKSIAPVHVEISPTNACNHRCIFCYADHSEHKMGTMERDILLKLMRDMGKIGVRSCLLAGDGEPLVNKHCIDAIIEGANAGVDMALNSNSILYTEEKAKASLPYLVWIRFSVMGHNPETYAYLHGTKTEDFNIAFTNIENSAKIKQKQNLDVTVGTQAVLLPENADGISELAQRIKNTGADYFIVKPFSWNPLNDYQGDSALDLAKKVEEELSKAEALSDKNFSVIIRRNTFSDDGTREYQKCYGLPFISQIAADSKVYTCCPFFGNPDYVLGDLKENSFDEIWHSEKAKAVLKKVQETQDVHKCMTFCRHHQINKLLWNLKNPPDHINFI